MAEQPNMPRPIPLSRRRFDIVLLVFFLINLLVITYIVDFEQLVIADPSNFQYPVWPPAFMIDAVHRWGGKPRILYISSGQIYGEPENPDAVFHRAVTAGATATAQPANEHGWRLGRITDPFGHEWGIATHVEDVPPAEMPARAEAAMKAWKGECKTN